jgi:ABC-type sulfate transport system substrate-binding protein
MPKIKVRPEATRNNNNPYCRALRHWIKKVAKSIKVLPLGLRHAQATTAHVGSGDDVQLHLAAEAWVSQSFGGDAVEHVFLAHHFAQVNVLHRVVAL